MTVDKFVKFTYHNGAKDVHAYLKMPLTTSLNVVRTDLELYLFEVRQLPKCWLRLYWIDPDGDEIDIITQADYDAFLNMRPDNQHLHVTPDLRKSNTPCKCLQKPSRDESCDTANVPEGQRIMIRVPSQKSATLLLSNCCGRRKRKRCSSAYPLPAHVHKALSQPGVNETERCFSRSQAVHVLSSFFSQFYDIMQNLVEGGTSDVNTPQADNAVPKQPEKPQRTNIRTEHTVQKKDPFCVPCKVCKRINTDKCNNLLEKSPTAEQSAAPSCRMRTNCNKLDLNEVVKLLEPQNKRYGLQLLNSFNETIYKMLTTRENGLDGLYEFLCMPKAASKPSPVTHTLNNKVEGPAAPTVQCICKDPGTTKLHHRQQQHCETTATQTQEMCYYAEKMRRRNSERNWKRGPKLTDRNEFAREAFVDASSSSSTDCIIDGNEAFNTDVECAAGSLNNGEQSTQTSNTTDCHKVPEPDIEDAVQTMLSMGFTSEEDSIRNLLQVANGDVAVALDLMDVTHGTEC